MQAIQDVENQHKFHNTFYDMVSNVLQLHSQGGLLPSHWLRHVFKLKHLIGPFWDNLIGLERKDPFENLSKRVGYETLNLYGSEVAYKIRFDGNVTRFTKIIFLTEVRKLILAFSLDHQSDTTFI